MIINDDGRKVLYCEPLRLVTPERAELLLGQHFESPVLISHYPDKPKNCGECGEASVVLYQVGYPVRACHGSSQFFRKSWRGDFYYLGGTWLALMETKRDEDSGHQEMINPFNIRATCFIDQKELVEGVVVPSGNGDLVPVCSLDLHLDIASSVKFEFITTEEGIRFRLQNGMLK